MEKPSAAKFTKAWFDKLEEGLHADARLAGLLGHGTMIGNAREFFISRVLRSVLPPSLHIGTGKIVAHNGMQSNQIDVVVYDSSFPFLEVQPGHGIYFAEGVVAAIEVKSNVDKNKLRKSLDNCRSVTRMPPAVMSRNVTMSLADMKPQAVSDSPTFRPCTYIFSYQASARTAGTFGKHFDEWWTDNKLNANNIEELPEVIVAGNYLGLSSGRWIKVDVTGELVERVRQADGNDPVIAMGFWQVQHPFAWLLMHLLTVVCDRSSAGHKMAIEKYLPHMEYWAAEIGEDKQGTVIHTPALTESEQ